MKASSPARPEGSASTFWRWARSWSARTFATISSFELRGAEKAPLVGPASDITAATPAPSMPSCLKRRPAASRMRCLVAGFWSLPYRIGNLSRPLHSIGSFGGYCIMVVLLYYARNPKPDDMEDHPDADHPRRRRGV